MLNHKEEKEKARHRFATFFVFLFPINTAISLYNINIPGSSIMLDMQQSQNIAERKYYCPRRNQSPEKQTDAHVAICTYQEEENLFQEQMLDMPPNTWKQLLPSSATQDALGRNPDLHHWELGFSRVAVS